MGTITRSFANNITTSGILLPASLNNNSIANVTSYNPAIATGNMVLISSQTASNSASISFTTGISSTYKEYQFWFIDMEPATNVNNAFQFQGSTDGGSNYGVTYTNATFLAYANQNGADAGLTYNSGTDLAQSTAFITLQTEVYQTTDLTCAGYISIFNPASTTYVKHTISTSVKNGQEAFNFYQAGYFNTTSALNAFQFKFNNSNMTSGTILMYGIV
jgi:hypothetical protein